MAVVAAWAQTLTGFALGLILMGGVGALGLMDVPQAATVTSILVALNGALVLRAGWRDLNRPILILMLVGAVPGLLAGYALLTWLAGHSLAMLQLLLGLAVAGSAVQLSLNATRGTSHAPPLANVLVGVAGGLMGGLFATPGPPLIWQLYRLPVGLATIRVILGAIFFVTLVLRLALVAADTGISREVLLGAAGAAPAVMLGTWIARRFPPPVSPMTLRRIALALLFLSGLALVRPGLAQLM